MSVAIDAGLKMQAENDMLLCWNLRLIEQLMLGCFECQKGFGMCVVFFSFILAAAYKRILTETEQENKTERKTGTSVCVSVLM